MPTEIKCIRCNPIDGADEGRIDVKFSGVSCRYRCTI